MNRVCRKISDGIHAVTVGPRDAPYNDWETAVITVARDVNTLQDKEDPAPIVFVINEERQQGVRFDKYVQHSAQQY